MTTVNVHASANDPSTYEAKSMLPGGINFVITGHCEAEADGRICYAFTMHYDYEYDDKKFRGYINGTSLSGKWGEGDLVHDFVFKRLAQNVLCWWPSPAELQKNKPQALWRFAINAVREQVLRERFSWTLLKTRRDLRKKYLDIIGTWPCSDEQMAERTRIRRFLTVADARVYYSMQQYLTRTQPDHW